MSEPENTRQFLEKILLRPPSAREIVWLEGLARKSNTSVQLAYDLWQRQQWKPAPAASKPEADKKEQNERT